MLRGKPRLHHNAMQKQSGMPKKTFEKHLKSLVERGKVTSYEYDGKKCYVIRSQSGLVFSSLPPDEQLEWKIAWKLQETQELFEAMKKSFDLDILNKSDKKFAIHVLEKIISNMVSIIIHDSLLSWKGTPHNNFIKEYRKLIKEYFESITPKPSKKIKDLSISKIPGTKKNLIKGKKFQIKASTHEEEPFAKEIAMFTIYE